jgi:hypothetical protein
MSVAKKKIVLKKLKEYDTIWHPETTLVFKSINERIVTGRYVDEQIIPLDEIALELCEKWNFKPDESLLASDEDDSKEDDSKQVEEEDDSKQVEEEDDSKQVEEEDEGKQVEEEDEGSGEDTEQKEDEVITEKITDITDEKIKVKSSTDTIQEQATKSIAIRSLTEGFTKELYTMVNNMENKLLATESQLSETEAELLEKTKALEELQSKYNTIKQKFDTMKSLFN